MTIEADSGSEKAWNPPEAWCFQYIRENCSGSKLDDKLFGWRDSFGDGGNDTVSQYPFNIVEATQKIMHIAF